MTKKLSGLEIHVAKAKIDWPQVGNYMEKATQPGLGIMRGKRLDPGGNRVGKEIGSRVGNHAVKEIGSRWRIV